MAEPSDISSANTEAGIVSAVVSTLAAAEISDVKVFAAVAQYRNLDEFRQKACTDSPIVGVLYLDTSEHRIPDLALGCVCRLELVIADRQDDSASANSALTRLANAARNAILADPPDGTRAFAEGETLYRQVAFENPVVDWSFKKPWAVVRVPVAIAYVLNSETSH